MLGLLAPYEGVAWRPIGDACLLKDSIDWVKAIGLWWRWV